jgi:hypothetical protein
MVMVPDPRETTTSKIFGWYEGQKESHRKHLGASVIGHHCDRYIWLSFRWVKTPSFEGRMRRLFETGNREELRVLQNLRDIGIEIYCEEDGHQIRATDESGHFAGSLDGIGRGFPEAPKSWAVIECKTSNTKAFKEIKQKGVKSFKPQHYAQMNVYMGWMKIDRAIYICVCKENDDIYTEWVHFDEAEFREKSEKARRLVQSSQPPVKLSEDPANWQCKMCDNYINCHEGVAAEINCRTCCNATPVEGGKWRCELDGNEIDYEKQLVGCDSHIFIPALVPNLEPFDGGENFVEYFVNGEETIINKAGTSKLVAKKNNNKIGGELEGDLNDEIPF